MKKYKGKIFSGLGISSQRVKDNLKLYKEKTGIKFFPGTLNIKLENEIEVPKNGILISSDEIKTTGRKTDILLIPGKYRNEKIFLLFAINSYYKKNVLEILASFNFRKKYNLKDGETIEIEM